MVKESIPLVSARTKAARRTRSRFKGVLAALSQHRLEAKD
jgi:hypothetical protein